MNNRVTRLRSIMNEEGLDACLISAPENRRYLSGFTGSAGYLLITLTEAVLATDFRYVEQGERQCPDFQIHRIKGRFDWLPELATQLGVKNIGFESGDLTVGTYNIITDAFQNQKTKNHVAFKPTAGLVDPLRTIKEPEELALITRAVEISDAAIEAVTATIEEGETERSVAWRLEKHMRESGAESIAFDTIVAAGPNSALPHHRPSDRSIVAGEPIVIDMGARYQGYNSDITRTICLGKPDETFRKIYDTVLIAQLTASATIQSNMTSGEADGIARAIIEEAGYGEQFGHSLGHGIGLAVHEFPRVGPSAEDPLANGTVFTIEPGIYIPGWGGVRIEDTVVMESGQVRALTQAHKRDNPKPVPLT
jgi:Xaa-Pro aminopeptidase